MKFLTMIDEMINIATLNKEAEETTAFFELPLEPFEIRIGCSTIIDWLYFRDTAPKMSLLLEKSLSNKYFLRFMELDSIKEFFSLDNGQLIFSSSTTKDDANEAIRYIKDNYRPKIRRTSKH